MMLQPGQHGFQLSLMLVSTLRLNGSKNRFPSWCLSCVIANEMYDSCLQRWQ